ncbi:hypothetical protein [Calidithermus chliarophilus]|uniref:hypothetical protein n=1 Tax=Calidithermus chliarophilus TaxID=52023 RepID=UPI0004866923|nr:hypothetical protein [Calidithermus chliarophilus]
MEGRWYGFTGGLPEVVIKIPRKALIDESIRVPRPTGDARVIANYEFTTSAYPTAGRGGALQFKAETSTFDPAWVSELNRRIKGRK